MARVSVNICCYNGEKYIADAIKSVLAQTFADFEIIVINDGSKDNTEKEILALKDGRIKYFFQENRGLAATRNRAIELSGGEFIAILDQDDLWEPDKLEAQVRLMDADRNVGVVYSDAYVIDSSGYVRGTGRKHRYRRGQIAMSLLKGNYIFCPTVMFRRSVLDKAGRFRTDLKIGEEYEMYLRLSRICVFDFVDKPVARYRVHESNVSVDIVKAYVETVMCLSEFAAVERDLKIRKTALKYADITRLKLVAALVWNNRGSEIPEVLCNIKSGKFPVFAALLRIMLYLPPCILKTACLPFKATGIVK